MTVFIPMVQSLKGTTFRRFLTPVSTLRFLSVTNSPIEIKVYEGKYARKLKYLRRMSFGSSLLSICVLVLQYLRVLKILH